jgi:hypothetical protein
VDITKEILPLNCPHCGKKIKLTFNSISCPYCSGKFNSDEVHNLFYQYESHLVNSKSYTVANNMEKAGDKIEKTGNALSEIGCALMLIPIAIIGLIIAWAALSS